MPDLQTEVARIERQIAHLASSAERCRKIDLIARIILTAGGVWSVGIALGLIRGDAVTLMVAIAALILGIVLYGSNRGTWNDVADRLTSLEVRRTRLIDAIDPVTVQDSTSLRRLE